MTVVVQVEVDFLGNATRVVPIVCPGCSKILVWDYLDSRSAFSCNDVWVVLNKHPQYVINELELV